MRIQPATPVFHSIPEVGILSQDVPPSSHQRPRYKRFIPPRTSHPFTRPWRQPPPQISPMDQRTGKTQRDGKGYDPTQRPDDPHIARINKRSFDMQRAINQLTQGAGTWQDSNRNNKTEIAYSFNNGGFNERQKSEARRSIESWSDVANLRFTENGGPAEGRLTFAISNRERSAYGTYPTPGHHGGGRTVYNPNFAHRHVITHEIGHALGLSHPGRYNGSASDGQRVYAQDSKAHTVMSYFEDNSSGKTLNATPKAPMMDDISAIQKKYGANREIRKEDNTYGFNSNTRRDYYTLNSGRDNATFCVWDGAGNDTLDFSGYRANQVINLRAGSFSDVGGLKGNVSIARDCSIENAIGGTANDVLIGNDSDNRLTGGLGGDRQRGGPGADTFVYNSARDSTPENPDVLMDFASGTDKIDVVRTMQEATISSLAFVNTFTGKSGDTVLTYDEKSGMGSVAIDLTGSGKADFLIKTHGKIKPEDIVTGLTTPSPRRVTETVTLPVSPTTEKARFTFESTSDSTYDNARVLTDFVSGTDKIDLSAVMKEANTPFTHVEAYTGRIGDTVVKYNQRSGRYFIGVDLTGNRSTDFLIKSTRPIRPQDIVGLTHPLGKYML